MVRNHSKSRTLCFARTCIVFIANCIYAHPSYGRYTDWQYDQDGAGGEYVLLFMIIASIVYAFYSEGMKSGVSMILGVIFYAFLLFIPIFLAVKFGVWGFLGGLTLSVALWGFMWMKANNIRFK